MYKEIKISWIDGRWTIYLGNRWYASTTKYEEAIRKIDVLMNRLMRGA